MCVWRGRGLAHSPAHPAAHTCRERRCYQPCTTSCSRSSETVLQPLTSVKCLSALPVHIPSAEGCSSASWHVPSASNSDLGSASLSVLSFRAIPSIPRQLHHASYCFLVSINCHSKSSRTGGSIIPRILKLPFGKAFGECSGRMNLQSLQLW